MSRRSYGRTVTLLVWTLVTIGLASGAVTNCLVGWTLLELNRERLRLLEDDRSLNQDAARLQRLSQEARSEIAALLQGGEGTAPESHLEFARTVRHLQENVADELLLELGTAAAAMREMHDQAQGWRDRFREVAADLKHKRTLGQARTALEQMRGTAETLEGQLRLEEAVLVRRWRQAPAAEAPALAAEILQRQSHGRARLLKEIRTELADLSHLVEALAGEDQLDYLADLRDNQLKPVLERLQWQVNILSTELVIPEGLSAAAVSHLGDILFGTGHTIVAEYQTIRLGAGGLFRLASDALSLRREREVLQLQSQEIFQRLEAIHPALAALTGERSRALARHAEASLTTGLRHLLLVSMLFFVGFLALGWLISGRVRRQVTALAQAESALQHSYCELTQRKEDLDALNCRLEEKVQERTSLLESKSLQLIQAQEELLRAEKLAAIGSLAAGVAHEINNPAAIIRGNIEILRRKLAADDPRREEMQEVVKQTERISRITQGLLTFARDQAISPERVAINPLLEEILAQAAHQVPLGGIEVRCDLDPALPPLPADRERLRQVFTNLVINALQAMDGTGTLIVGSRWRKKAIEVSVADTGPGVPTALRGKIFNPFFTTKPTGTGLGLSVSYGIVQALGGTIEVGGGPDRGTTFTIRLPVAGAAPMPGSAPGEGVSCPAG